MRRGMAPASPLRPPIRHPVFPALAAAATLRPVCSASSPLPSPRSRAAAAALPHLLPFLSTRPRWRSGRSPPCSPATTTPPQRTALGRPTSTQALAQLKAKLVAPGPGRVGAAVLAEPLQIPADQAAVALGALAAVLPGDDDDPTADGAWEADLHDVLLFLYIQSYKRLVPRLRFHPFAPV
ncbi:hypothetical protein VPH35_078698 [Triticum aestivum]